MSFLKPKPAVSENTNNKMLTGTYGSVMNQGVGANNILSSLLTGTGDTAGAQAGLQGYMDNAGYKNVLQQLTRGITGGQAAGGM